MSQALVNDAALPRSATVRGAESVQPMSGFEDYTSAQETKQKLLRDVFERGDAWYAQRPSYGQRRGRLFYFVDRIGDTFRWRGGNVARRKLRQQSRPSRVSQSPTSAA